MVRAPVRVLVAEDDYLVGEMIRGMLEVLGYVVIGEAVTGQEAIRLTVQLRPDVVLMDWSMPDMDGVVATQRIFEMCPTPVVILSAHSSRELIAAAGTAGVGAYLVKPPTRAELDRAITIARARFDDMIKLRQLNADLEARNAELDTFAGLVAHELAQPLTYLMGYAGAIELGIMDFSDAEIADSLKKIMQSVRRMTRITDDLLQLVHLREAEIALVPVPMATVVQETLMRLQDVIQQSGAVVQLPESWPVVWGFAPWIEQVWLNYLSNALKYGGRPAEQIAPHLVLGWEPVPVGDQATVKPPFVCDAPLPPPVPMIRFWVRDNGVGLTPEEQALLFRPFSRLDSKKSIEGHGLGLSIVRFIVEKLGGKTSVESVKGVGSTFSFTLPAVVSEQDITSRKHDTFDS